MTLTLTDEQAKAADAACDALVREYLRKGMWVSSQEWIVLYEREAKKALDDAALLSSWL